MKQLTFWDILHTARLERKRGRTIEETMIYLYGMTHGLENYYLEAYR